MRIKIPFFIFAASLLFSGCTCSKQTEVTTEVASGKSGDSDKPFTERVRSAIQAERLAPLRALAQEANQESQDDLQHVKADILEREAIRSGNPKIMTMLGKEMANHVVRFELFSAASEKQYPASMFELSRCYEQGLGTLMDLKKSAELLIAAAHAGDASAQHTLGINYLAGLRGFKKDRVEGCAWSMVARANWGVSDIPQGLTADEASASRIRAEELWKTCKSR